MNKNDLISAVSEQAGITKADASKAVEAVFDSISGALAKGSEVRLVGFGTFSVSKRKASTGRNPRTGDQVDVDAKHVPFFKTGKEMRERLNNGYDGE